MSSTPTDQSSSEKYYLVKSTDSMGSLGRNFNNNNMNSGVDAHNLWKYNKQHHQHHHHLHQQLMHSYNNISNSIANDNNNVIGNNSLQMHQRHQQQQQPLSATSESGVGIKYV